MKQGYKVNSLDIAIDQVNAILPPESAEDPTLEASEGFGRYEGLPPQVELSDDGRTVRLLRPLSYYQEAGDAWPVPAGTEADGASIPRAFWSLIGGPFEGKYRNASIVHDHYCVTRDRPWAQVHRMFHEAMRCSGVDRTRAGVMYYAVYRFGPRWPGLDALEALEAAPMISENADPAGIVADMRAIADGDLDPDAIETLANWRDQRETQP